jgi:hypothetical protein
LLPGQRSERGGKEDRRTAVEAIEHSLIGLPAEPAAVIAAVESVYRRLNVRSPGIEPADWAAAVLKAAGLEP